MPNLKNENLRSPASRVFAHLSEEERIDQACELLALGVLRLAEKRGLLKKQKEDALLGSDQIKDAA